MRRPSSAWLSPPELLSRHGAWLDGGPGRAEDFFTEDVEVRSPRAHLQGRPAVAAFLEETAREQTQHLLTDVVVELDGDRAQVEANQLVQFVRAPGAAPTAAPGSGSATPSCGHQLAGACSAATWSSAGWSATCPRRPGPADGRRRRRQEAAAPVGTGAAAGAGLENSITPSTTSLRFRAR